MKKPIVLFALLLVLFSCKEETIAPTLPLVLRNTTTQNVRQCASHEVLQEQIVANPKLKSRMAEIESFTRRAIQEGRLVNGKIEIPVVVNVLYRTVAENISIEQIQSQIDVLNRDFNALNCDYYSTPSIFAQNKANIEISFVLQGTVRKKTTTVSWSPNDAMKKSMPPTMPTTVLNIWVCNMGGGILGYAQFPGGNSLTDGVVVDNNAFGTVGLVGSPFNLGRTLTHEVGHWMNLRHIWGDAKCGNDFVADTPVHDSPNYGSPSQPHNSTCTGLPEMTMNYMDYTDDRAMYMFSNGQKERMKAIFVVGGVRESFGRQ